MSLLWCKEEKIWRPFLSVSRKSQGFPRINFFRNVALQLLKLNYSISLRQQSLLLDRMRTGLLRKPNIGEERGGLRYPTQKFVT